MCVLLFFFSLQADCRSHLVFPSSALWAGSSARRDRRPDSTSERTQTVCQRPAGPPLRPGGVGGPLLYVLGEKSDLLSCQQPAPDVADGGELHFLSVFTVNIQEDAKEHQQAAPDVPEEGEAGRLELFQKETAGGRLACM